MHRNVLKKYLISAMFTTSFLIGVIFVRINFSAAYSNLPGEISKQVAAKFFHGYRHSDSRCKSDENYCETNRNSCMQQNEDLREVLCARNNRCTPGQTCYLSNPCPANFSTGCTTNVCYGVPCHNGGSCSIDSSNKGYSCHCQSGFDPFTDCLTRHREPRSIIIKCRVNICKNGGLCRQDLFTRSTWCICLPGFDGDGCENNITECQCVHGNCTDRLNMTSCDCHPGFTGVNCDTNINECNCVHGNCSGDDNMYTCECDPGYTGTICDTGINECQSSPCVHGNCTDDVNMYTCDCQPGFTGVNCDTDINECQSSPCVHGNCTDDVNMYTCDCQPGFTGVNCDIDINECQCVHGNCTDNVNMTSCDCQSGFTGVICDTEINGCHSSPCVHGTCQNKASSYSCSCDLLYGGKNCDEVNVGAIVPIVLGPVCASALGYLGFVLYRNKIGRKNFTTPLSENQDAEQHETSERSPDKVFTKT